MKKFGKEKKFDEKDEQNERKEIRHLSFCFSLFSMSSQSFNDELINVKLKSTKNKTKDFSDPKFAGFLSENEIHSYQNDVIESNIEQWQKYLSDETFATKYFPIHLSDAEFFLRIFEKYFRDLHEKQLFDEIRRRKSDFSQFDDDEKLWIEQFSKRLQNFIDEHFPHSIGFFVKTSSRSAKDAVIFNENFLQIYQNELKKFENENEENSRIFALLTTAFVSLRVSTSKDVLSMFFVSERIYQDFRLAIEVFQRRKIFVENFVLRQFFPIDVDLEFRAFVYQRRLTCLSQYNYLIYSKRLNENKEKILEKISKFFNEIIQNKFKDFQCDNYVIDFALTQNSSSSSTTNFDVDSMKVWVIELNPFLETTDGALFSWQKERDVLEGKSSEVIFRLTERIRTGSWSMLPISIRQWIQNVN